MSCRNLLKPHILLFSNQIYEAFLHTWNHSEINRITYSTMNTPLGTTEELVLTQPGTEEYFGQPRVVKQVSLEDDNPMFTKHPNELEKHTYEVPTVMPSAAKPITLNALRLDTTDLSELSTPDSPDTEFRADSSGEVSSAPDDDQAEDDDDSSSGSEPHMSEVEPGLDLDVDSEVSSEQSEANRELREFKIDHLHDEIRLMLEEKKKAGALDPEGEEMLRHYEDSE